MAEDKIIFPFDPLERSALVESVVMRGSRRVYHRFRPAPYYGGIATADAVGCSFLCAYCWSYYRNLYPQRFKNFYTSQQVASKLLHIARRKSYRLFRISGAEPILGEGSFQHLVEVLKIIFRTAPHGVFILETNGFFLGYKVELISQLQFENLRIRICLKGTDEDSFERITGVKKDFFPYPIRALKKLEEVGIRAWPALMRDLFRPEEIDRLDNLLDRYEVKADLELEALEAYPLVLENMKKRKVKIEGSL